MTLYKITVKGQVQGVGFRWAACRIANFYNINGIVKNLPNGDVYIEAEGEQSQLAEFNEWCKKGPFNAIVKEVVIKECAIKNYAGFTITF